MISTATLNNNSNSGCHHQAQAQTPTIRRPTLFMSPASANPGSVRLLSPQSASPTPPRLHPNNNNNNNNGDSALPEVRLVVLGALGVGKSALVVKYITRRFIVEYDPLLEDVYTKSETLASRTVNVKIMDTSDSPNKKPERYLKWADGYIVVYSIVCRASFDQAAIYLDTVSKYQRIRASDGPLALVGNKADLERYRTVGRSEAEALASRFDCVYLETSAAEDLDSVTDAFGRILSDVMRLRSRQPSLQTLFISEDRHKMSPKSSSAAGAATSGDVTVDKKEDSKLQQQTPDRKSVV